MWEVSSYGTASFGSFMLGGQRGRPFVVVPAEQGLGFGGGEASTFFVYERTPLGTRSALAVRTTDTSGLHSPSSDVLGGGVAIGAGDEQDVVHMPSSTEYVADAELIAALRLISREEMARVLDEGDDMSSWFWFSEQGE